MRVFFSFLASSFKSLRLNGDFFFFFSHIHLMQCCKLYVRFSFSNDKKSRAVETDNLECGDVADVAGSYSESQGGRS